MLVTFISECYVWLIDDFLSTFASNYLFLVGLTDEETGKCVGNFKVAIRRRWNYENNVSAIVCYLSTGKLFLFLIFYDSFDLKYLQRHCLTKYLQALQTRPATLRRRPVSRRRTSRCQNLSRPSSIYCANWRRARRSKIHRATCEFSTRSAVCPDRALFSRLSNTLKAATSLRPSYPRGTCTTSVPSCRSVALGTSKQHLLTHSFTHSRRAAATTMTTTKQDFSYLSIISRENCPKFVSLPDVQAAAVSKCR